MSLYITKSEIIITCPKRLSPYLEKEVKELGYETIETFITGVRLYGTINDCIKLNLNLRCASQVLYSLKILCFQSPLKPFESTRRSVTPSLLPPSPPGDAG